jgi:cupin 2 domain-containing protein
MEDSTNRFADIPVHLPEELVQTLPGTSDFRIERIVSPGHASPEGFRHDQDWHEWVLALTGAARLTLEGEGPLQPRPGSFINIPARKRHRVEWTDPTQPPVRLAVDYGDRT